MFGRSITSLHFIIFGIILLFNLFTYNSSCFKDIYHFLFVMLGPFMFHSGPHVPALTYLDRTAGQNHAGLAWSREGWMRWSGGLFSDFVHRPLLTAPLTSLEPAVKDMKVRSGAQRAVFDRMNPPDRHPSSLTRAGWFPDQLIGCRRMNFLGGT